MLKITKRKVTAAQEPIMAADEDIWGDPESGDVPEAEADDELLDEEKGTAEAIDDLADNVEDVQDQIEDINEDDPTIEVDNNIADHYIAECDRCHGVFISAVIKSDQEVEKISGICPLCEHESDQFLRWIVEPVNK